MNKTKVILISVILVICLGLLIGTCVLVLGDERTTENKTFKEIYNELPENEQKEVKEQYDQFKSGELDLMNPETQIKIPDALKDKIMPPALVDPIKDFLGDKDK